MRGNVGTRLRKLDEGQFDALVMASAGLKRLGLGDRIRQIIPAEVSLPAPGQGALGIEIRKGDEKMEAALGFINSPETRACCMLNVQYRAHWRFLPGAARGVCGGWKTASSGCARSSATIRKARPRSLKPAVLWPSPKRSPLVLLKTCAVKVQKII